MPTYEMALFPGFILNANPEPDSLTGTFSPVSHS